MGSLALVQIGQLNKIQEAFMGSFENKRIEIARKRQEAAEQAAEREARQTGAYPIAMNPFAPPAAVAQGVAQPSSSAADAADAKKPSAGELLS